jgi:hypothetical protein
MGKGVCRDNPRRRGTEREEGGRVGGIAKADSKVMVRRRIWQRKLYFRGCFSRREEGVLGFGALPLRAF